MNTNLYDINKGAQHSIKYEILLSAARKKGWVIPVNNGFPEHAWIKYWTRMFAYEADRTGGRPIPPHRSA